MSMVLLQANPHCGNFNFNIAHLAEMVRAYLHNQATGSEFILFITASYALTGAPWELLANVHGFYERGLWAAKELAKSLANEKYEHDFALLTGVPGPTQPAFLLIQAGGVSTLSCSNDGLLQVGSRIFYLPEMDIHGISGLAESIGRRGIDAILFQAPYPYTANAQKNREMAGSALASNAKLPVIYVNMAGATDGLVFSGQSCVFDASGLLLSRAEAFEPDTILADGKGVRRIVPTHLREEGMFKAACAGIRDYMRKTGFKSVLIGLSGGMDSALVACMAVEALGPENVFGLLMPSPYSTGHSLSDAKELATNLGIKIKTIPITSMLYAFNTCLTDALADYPAGPEDLVEENLQARLRGVLLMAFANRLRGVVLGTGNKSENAVGFCTLYGDTVAALEPIGDFYKTEVYTVAEWYNRHKGWAIIPPNILCKPPSAELKHGQVDQDTLPPYDILDLILQHFFEKGLDPATMDIPGIPRELISHIAGMVQRAEFKRQQSPPPIKVSSCTLGMDWSMPITARFFI